VPIEQKDGWTSGPARPGEENLVPASAQTPNLQPLSESLYRLQLKTITVEVFSYADKTVLSASWNETALLSVRLEVLTKWLILRSYWNVTPCNLVGEDREEHDAPIFKVRRQQVSPKRLATAHKNTNLYRSQINSSHKKSDLTPHRRCSSTTLALKTG